MRGVLQKGGKTARGCVVERFDKTIRVRQMQKHGESFEEKNGNCKLMSRKEILTKFLESPVRKQILQKFLDSVERRYLNVHIKPGHRRVAGVICDYCEQKKNRFVVMNYEKHSDMLMCRDCQTNWIPSHMSAGCCSVVGRVATIQELQSWPEDSDMEGYI